MGKPNRQEKWSYRSAHDFRPIPISVCKDNKIFLFVQQFFYKKWLTVWVYTHIRLGTS